LEFDILDKETGVDERALEPSSTILRAPQVGVSMKIKTNKKQFI
jgi:hypothetical protein